MRKKYVKPYICREDMENSIEQIAPLAALAPAAALVGGYVAGRAAKKTMEERVERRRVKLESVIM